jgi:hypothetical protein
MISANRLTVTFTGFGIPTEPNETNPTMIKHKIFEAMKDDLSESDGVNDYVNSVKVFIESDETTYQEIATRMAELTDEIVQLSRVAWQFQPGVELLTEQIRTILKEVDSPFNA